MLFTAYETRRGSWFKWLNILLYYFCGLGVLYFFSLTIVSYI